MRRIAPFFLFAAVFAVGVALRGQQTADQTLAQLKPAAGLEVKLFASEPMVTNPTDMTIDERGRVWVLEGANYRRTQRQLPDIRPAGDRIVILEDTNGDGKADRSKVFDQDPKIRVPLGIAVLGDKVYVSQSPDIIVYTKDANDKILKKEVLLTGFNGIDHDHGLHAVVFGPDGKFYFNQGNTGLDVTDKAGKRIFMQAPSPAAGGGGGGNQGAAPANPIPPQGPGYYQGVVLRMNPDGTGLTVLGQNFRNPYEVAVDSWGNVWQTDNDDDGYAWTRLLYNMEGGNYGYRGPGNKTWSEDHGTHWHQELPGVAPLLYRIGAGSPCGLLVYEGKLLPAKYRGQLMHADAGKRILAMYPLEERGAGFEGRSEDILNDGDDTWARPVDVAVAPDGALFVADWYDPGVGGHLMGDDGTRGRVYRIAPVGNKPVVPKVDLTSPAGLTAAFGSPNMSTNYVAYMALKSQGKAAVPALQSMWRQIADPILRARALWLLGGLAADEKARMPANAQAPVDATASSAASRAILEAMGSSNPNVRVLGLRVARHAGANMLTFSKPFLRDGSAKVRREIALMLQDPTRMLPPYAFTAQVQPAPEWLDAMATLASQYDGKDRWYLEAIGIAARGREDALYARLKQQSAGKPSAPIAGVVWAIRPKAALPDLIATINNASATAADRTVALDTLGNMEWPEAAKAVESFILASSTPAPLAEHAFDLYSHQLFSLWTDSRKSPSLGAVMAKAFTLPGAQSAAVTLADSLNDPQFAPALLGLAKSTTAGAEVRAAAIDSLGYAKDTQRLMDFQVLADSGPTLVRVAAVRAIATLGQPGTEPWAQKLLLSTAPNEVRAEALRLLSGSAAGLNTVLDLAERGTLPAELKTLASNLTNNANPPAPAGRGGRRGGPQSPVTIRQRGAVPTDPVYIAIRERAAKLLPAPAARRIPSSFEIDLNYGAKAADGKKVFDTDAACSACHSVGGPTKLGPDLAHIGTKYGKQALLDSIISPSEGISPEYVPTTFVMKNGDTVAGLISEERPDQITVQIGPNQQQRLKPADVASRKEMRVSLMPEGLLSNLSLQQIADLLEYLASLK